MENETLATELLHEVKASAKRWFIAFMVVLVLWFATIGGFVWYLSLPVEEVVIEQDSDNNGSNQVIGGDYNGTPEGTQNNP
jgi:cell division septal protein FtsQ